MGRFQLVARGRQYIEDLGVNGRSGRGLGEWHWREGNISQDPSRRWDWPHPSSLTPGGLRSGSCQGRAYSRPGKKEGLGRKVSIRRIPDSRGSIFEMGCSLTPLSLLQVYFVLNYRTIQGLCLCWADFVQRLISTRSISPIKHKFFPPTCPERLRGSCHEAGGRRSSQPRTIIWGHLGLIRDSLDARELGQGDIPVVLDDDVDTYACGRHSTSSFRGIGGIGFTGPWWIFRDFWSCYQWQN